MDKQNDSIVDENAVLSSPKIIGKKKQTRKKRGTKKSRYCWENCKKCLLDETDYVHICLTDSFVTYSELKRMMGK